jgi:phospholipid/cholesterol/gamma-HCH transport system permease protein
MITSLGRYLMQSWSVTREFLIFLSQTVHFVFTSPPRIKEIIAQLDFVAVQSALIIVFCVGFAAAVTIIEASFHMKLVIHNDSMVPGFAALLILRELGSVVTALLLTSRVGAGYAAEVGSMQVSEQIDALRMLGIEPIEFLVVPRLIACTIGGFVLSLVANCFCIAAAMLVSTLRLSLTMGGFLTGMRAFVHFQDLLFAGVKGAVFGAVIPLMSCFFGFRCRAGAEGVGLATTGSVVATSVCIIVIDFILTYLFSYFY